MLSGRKAITGKTAMEVARRVIEAPPPDLAELVPGTPRRAAEALKRGMAKDPGERPATVGELVRELSAAYAEAAVEPRPAAAPRAAAAQWPATPRTAATAPLGEHRGPRRRARPGWLVPALLVLAAAAVLAIALLGGSGGGDETANQPARKTHSKPHGRPSTTPATAAAPQQTQPSTSQPAPPSAFPAASKALDDFYTLAANHDFAGAWALGTDNLHAQFNGSIDTFRGTFATLRSIQFPELRVASQSGDAATVQFSSIAVHTDRTDRCSGQAGMVRAGSQWLVDHIAVNCGSGGAPKGPTKPKKAKKPKPPKRK
jgi:hypothetical protein